MSKTFFSVDVETTSSNPFAGQLLTIGILPIDGETLEIGKGMYFRLEYDNIVMDDADTHNWWLNQEQFVYDEAWNDIDEREQPVDVANLMSTWVKTYSNNLHDRIFTANPVSFDYPWIQKLFSETGVKNPFSYRTLCMRSMYFGIVGGEWGKNREDDNNWHHSEHPHHAYYDAKAQALDFVKMYRMCHENLKTKELSGTVSDVYD